jgi:hypothetical protein
MKLIRKWKRRKPGVYAWRAECHRNRARREWIYVGESVNIGMRDRCHFGTCAHRPKVQYVGGGGTGMQGTVISGRGCYAKPWTDLRPVRHTIIRLPWWLGWKWVLRPLETLVILALAPRYNWQKNAWNPRRVPPTVQAMQRAQRNGAGPTYQARAQAARALGIVLRAAGVLLILAGLSGYLITR